MPQATTDERLTTLCENVLAPLVEADGGELFVVGVTSDSLTLHLAGTCSGCPGASLTTRVVLEPAVRAVAPGVKLVVTTGARVPAGARRVGAANSTTPA